ncbi:DNA topoisomerase [Clostridium chauvoei]|uniref:DNA topoisomerase n=2 Tax=Clostridium chauvoei TaxID=46867 RepID=S6FAQ7_9CLOT|nr:DNA topoisomerase [Clostridium chauvoei]ATD55439.1 DNA topoisomerase III [Clostridium chauvoei]ATD56889.1 DNA topoisomerase III [Clostridium chauvoei]MBX7280650.1 type IA DNA topoisomerase [Clostridium chauvoei]MBX7283134.1 type IA DNA topoisomerase [Clostridium chauvoei]MBX7286871.1 type IA DNA topoisomerase [Clostridium chauvoei]
MGKTLFIAEKPSVAMDFVKLLNVKAKRNNGYIEGEKSIFTWCVGHMVTMSYPEVYDEKLKFWNLRDLPFLPKEYKYEVIPSASAQFNVVSSLMNRDDVDTIYVCTDSGREGEYIYRLVDDMAGNPNKVKKRVWIDSQTEEEIKRGIKEAKPLSEYDSLAYSAYLRAKEDYIFGINFSRLLTLRYGRVLANIIKTDKNVVIAVGRVMTCVLGMVVEREREIREFKKTSFYKISGEFSKENEESLLLKGEWKAIEGSKFFESPKLYNEVGFKKKEDAEILMKEIRDIGFGIIKEVKKTKEKKNAPLLFNLAEIQNECTKKFKISPDETLKIIQGLYEKKMVTYPRTDARVLSTAVAKGIKGNLMKLIHMPIGDKLNDIVKTIISKDLSKSIIKSKYVDDSKITDHYAIIPTGEGKENLNRLPELDRKIYILILKRFLSIFYPPAQYSKIAITISVGNENFLLNKKVCIDKGYLVIIEENKNDEESDFQGNIRKGTKVNINELEIKEGETSPPKRYTTGSMIIAMENAGKLIEDEELREHIKGAGIGTSATRAEILKKLMNINYIKSNSKTQILTPTELGEMIYESIRISIPSLLNPSLTASWEKGLKLVNDKEIEPNEFMIKLEAYTRKNTSKVLSNSNMAYLNAKLSKVKEQYSK